MSQYNTLASFYDALTENVQYEARSAYISGFFSRYGVQHGSTVLDLACGTGSLTACLRELGYQMTGVDLSPDMLTLAKQKCPDCDFILCSMTEYIARQKFDACVSALDSVNHLCSMDEVKQCFSAVAASLKPNGMFVFDVNTKYKHNQILANHTFVFDEDDFYLVWDNEAVDDSTVRILIDVFCYNGKNYDRMSEDFLERAYDLKELQEALADFEILGVFDELTENPPAADSQRLYFVCKRK